MRGLPAGGQAETDEAKEEPVCKRPRDAVEFSVKRAAAGGESDSRPNDNPLSEQRMPLEQISHRQFPPAFPLLSPNREDPMTQTTEPKQINTADTLTLRIVETEEIGRCYFRDRRGEITDLTIAEFIRVDRFLREYRAHGWEGRCDETLDPIESIEWEGRLLRAFAKFARAADPAEKRLVALLLEDRLKEPGDRQFEDNMLSGRTFRKLHGIEEA